MMQCVARVCQRQLSYMLHLALPYITSQVIVLPPKKLRDQEAQFKLLHQHLQQGKTTIAPQD